MIYRLTDEERAEVAALLLPLELGEMSARRIAVELVMLRKLAFEVRRVLPRHLEHVAPGIRDIVERIPLPGQKPAWNALAAEHFEQRGLIE